MEIEKLMKENEELKRENEELKNQLEKMNPNPQAYVKFWPTGNSESEIRARVKMEANLLHDEKFGKPPKKEIEELRKDNNILQAQLKLEGNLKDHYGKRAADAESQAMALSYEIRELQQFIKIIENQ